MAANNIYIQVDLNSALAQQNVNALNKAIGDTGPTAEKSSKKATDALGSINISVAQTTKAFGHLTAAIAGWGVGRMISDLVKTGSELGRAQTMMTMFTGSASAAAKVFDQIRSIAHDSPFRLLDLAQTTQQLVGFGIEAEKVPHTVQVISDQVAAMGGSIETVNSIVRIFGRVANKEFVSINDLMRQLPQRGVEVGEALKKALGVSGEEDISKAIKSGAVDATKVMDLMLDTMEKKTKGAGALIHDFSKTMKNLGDDLDYARMKILGAFGPALEKLAEQVQKLLAPVAGLVIELAKLPEDQKERVVQIVAITGAVAALTAALIALSPVISGLSRLLPALGSTLVAVFTNPALLAGIAAIVAGVGALYYFKPELAKKWQDDVTGMVSGMWDKVKAKLDAFSKEGQEFFAKMTAPQKTEATGSITTETDENLKKMRDQVQKWATEAGKITLQAFGVPAEEIAGKYADLTEKLNEDMKTLFLTADHQEELRQQLRTAQSIEETTKLLEQQKKLTDEKTKYDVERTKGSYDAQIEYIEAMDEQNFQKKIRDIDRIKDLRVKSAEEVARLETDQLQAVANRQIELLKAYPEFWKAMGVDVGAAVKQIQEDAAAKAQVINQKAFDDEQKYRLEGWKKANDLIIEDQKRVFESFKGFFDELFDAFTGKAKDIGKAVTDIFKKEFMGEVKNLFSTPLTQASTAAAGYGWPEAQIGRNGILSAIMMRGTPPRPPLPPPAGYSPGSAPTTVGGYKDLDGANRLVEGAHIYDNATMVFAKAVTRFAGATVQNEGSADRAADSADDFSDAFDKASSATGVSQTLLRAVAMEESGMHPRAVGKPTSTGQALGLMQLMPSVQKQFGVSDAFDPGQNVMGGARLLEQLLGHYGGDTNAALAAYAMGQGGYDKAMARGGKVSPEAQNAVRKIQILLAQGGAPSSRGPGISADYLNSLPMSGGYNLAATMPSAGSYGPPAMAGPSAPSFDLPSGMLAGGVSPAMGPTTADLNAMPMRGGYDLASTVAAPGHLSWAKNLTGSMANLKNFVINQKIWDQTGTSFGAYAGSVLTSPAATMAGSMLATQGLFGSKRGTGWGILEGAGGGALVGAGMGAQFGPEGALIGAGVGLAAGFLVGLGENLAGVETPQRQAKRLAMQLYRININSATADKVVEIANSNYAGRVSVAMRSPEVRQMLGLYAAGTGQANSFPPSVGTPHGASLVESGGQLSQQATYQYGNAYSQASDLPVYGGAPTHVIGAGMQLSLNIGGQNAAQFLQGQVVSPEVIQTQQMAAMQSSNGRVSQALMMAAPGSIAG